MSKHDDFIDDYIGYRIDCRSKIQTIDSTSSFKLELSPEEHTLPKDKLHYLDYLRIFEELEQYKNHNMIFKLKKAGCTLI